MPETNGSMFKRVEDIEKEMVEHDGILEDHTLQLKIQAEQIKQLNDNNMRLENLIMSENRETRLTITNTNGQLQEVIKGLMGYNSGNNQLTNTLKMARTESIVKIIGILAGSGGVLYWIFGQ